MISPTNEIDPRFKHEPKGVRGGHYEPVNAGNIY